MLFHSFLPCGFTLYFTTTYIYIYRERDLHIYVYTYSYIYVGIMYVNTYTCMSM